MPSTAHSNLSCYQIIQRGERSWWVSASQLGWDGQPLPFGRLVYFAHSAEQACAWVERCCKPAATGAPC